MARIVIMILGLLTALPAYARPALTPVQKASRCLQSGIWLSTEYSTKVLAARLGTLPGLAVTTDRHTWGFSRGRFILESYFVLEGTIGGSHIRSLSSGSVDSGYRVRERRGSLNLVFSNVVVDRITTVGEADGIQADAQVQEDIHQLQEGFVPFTCSGRRLTIRVRNQTGSTVRVRFSRAT